MDKNGGPARDKTLLDEFAALERSEPPIGDSAVDAARYLGANPKDYQPAIHWPLILAKWRYECAAAMLAEKARREADDE